MGAVVLAGWALLLGYNLFFFGHPEGLPQPHPTLTGTSVTRVLALVFDRDQGLLVQVPTVLLGVLGLWAARRMVPWAVGATVAGSVLMILVNGTFTSDVPFGGAALAGRFEWTVAPMLLAWAPFLLVAIERHRARILGVACRHRSRCGWRKPSPSFEGTHQYVNAMIAPFAPWDPTLYPGWWPGLGGALPTFLAPGLHERTTWSHLVVELLLAGAITLRPPDVGPARPVAGRAGRRRGRRDCARSRRWSPSSRPARDEPPVVAQLARSRHRLALVDGRARHGLRPGRAGRRRSRVLSRRAHLRRHRRLGSGHGVAGRGPLRPQRDVGLVHTGAPDGRATPVGHATAFGSLRGAGRPRRAPARAGGSRESASSASGPSVTSTRKARWSITTNRHVDHRPAPDAAASQQLRGHDPHVDQGRRRGEHAGAR